MSVLAWTETTILADGVRLSRWERSELEFTAEGEAVFRGLLDADPAPWTWTPPHAGGRLELHAVPAPSGARMAAIWLIDGIPAVHVAILPGGSTGGDARLLETIQTMIDAGRPAGAGKAVRNLLDEPSRPLAVTITAWIDPARDVSEPLRLIPEMTSLLALAFFRRAFGG